MNKEIPVPDPFSKEYEYFFPSATWEKINGEIPLSAEIKTTDDMPEIDVRIPEQ